MRYILPFLLLLIGCDKQANEASNDGTSKSDRPKNSVNVKEDTKDSLNEYVFHWENKFDIHQQKLLVSYLSKVKRGIESTFGSYPFPVHVYMHTYSGSEPIPWAHTTRSFEQGVHLYIGMPYDDSLFMKDWTAPHELSHLALPFVGRSNMWFSEGFATYMQHQVLLAMDAWTSSEVDNKFTAKYEKYAREFIRDEPMIDVLKDHMYNRKYGALYWGGVTYFTYVEQLLQEKNMSLLDILKTYQSTKRMEDESLLSVINSLDELSGTNIFSETMKLFRTKSAKDLYLMSTGIDPQAG